MKDNNDVINTAEEINATDVTAEALTTAEEVHTEDVIAEEITPSEPLTQAQIFGAKLKNYRKAKRMSQKEFAASLGMSFRTYQNYEVGNRYPNSMDIINKIAVGIGTTTEELIGAAGGYIVEAGEKGGARDKKRMEQMVTQLSAMFAGGEIDQESKDAAMAALNEVYWKHKTENRERFTTKKNKKDQE